MNISRPVRGLFAAWGHVNGVCSFAPMDPVVHLPGLDLGVSTLILGLALPLWFLVHVSASFNILPPCFWVLWITR